MLVRFKEADICRKNIGVSFFRSLLLFKKILNKKGGNYVKKTKLD